MKTIRITKNIHENEKILKVENGRKLSNMVYNRFVGYVWELFPIIYAFEDGTFLFRHEDIAYQIKTHFITI